MHATSKVRSYKDLIVWQKGLLMVKAIYKLTSRFPADERFGLVTQMRRAAVSVPSNIAEGQSRHTAGEFVQFISIAEGSLAELETQLLIACDLGICNQPDSAAVLQQIEELQKMLNGLRTKLTPHPSPLVTRF